MKKMSAIILLQIGMSLSSFSQSVNHQNEIAEYLGLDRFQELQQTNPGLISFLDTQVEFGFAIIDVIAGKESEFTRIDKVQIHSKTIGENVTVYEFLDDFYSGDFNFLMYVFPCLPQLDQYFLLGDSGKGIVIYSVAHINSKIVQQ